MHSGTVHGPEGRQKCKTQPSLEDACQEGHDNCDTDLTLLEGTLG